MQVKFAKPQKQIKDTYKGGLISLQTNYYMQSGQNPKITPAWPDAEPNHRERVVNSNTLCSCTAVHFSNTPI